MRPRFDSVDVFAILLVIGGPIALVRYGGWPLPTALPTRIEITGWLREPMTPGTVTAGFIGFLWLTWVALAGAAVLQGYRWAAGRLRLPRLRMPGPVQAFTAALLGATAVGNAAGAAADVGASGDATAAEGFERTPTWASFPDRLAATTDPPGEPAGASSRPVATTSLVAASVLPQRPPAFDQAAGGRRTVYTLAGRVHDRPAEAPTLRAVTGTSSVTMTYTVAEGDWLWHVADRFLGDPHRYQDLAALNPHLAAKHSEFPDHVEPGDRLRLPSDAHDDGPRRHARGTLSLTPSPAHRPPTPPEVAEPSPSQLDPDGVVEPAAPQSPTTPSSTADGDDTDSTGSDVAGVPVPAGWLTIGFAAALCAAAATVWARRRIHYDPAVRPDPDDAALQPLPPTVSLLRRAVDRQAPQLLQPPDPGPTVREYAQMDPKPPIPPPGPGGPELAGWGPLPPDGLGLTGPGATDAARAMLVAALSAGHPHDLDACATVVIPTGTLTALIGTSSDLAGAMPRLIVAADLPQALARLHQESLRRADVLEDADATTITQLRQQHPYAEPLSPMLLITDAPDAGMRPRLSAILRLGEQMDIGAVVLGDWPDGTTVHVDTDGTSTGPDHQRLSVLDSEAAQQLLAVLREAHTGQPTLAAAAPPDQATVSSDLPEDDVVQPADEDQADRRAVTDQAAPQTASGAATVGPVAVTAKQPSAAAPPTADTANDDGEATLPVRVQILGKVAIYTPAGSPVPGLRRKAGELLAFLATRRGGVSIDDVKEALWPDAPVSRAKQRLATDVANLRACLRTGAGIIPGDQNQSDAAAGAGGRRAGSTGPAFVVNTGGRYLLAADLVSVDWWQVQDAVTRAATAPDTAGRITALQQAVQAFNGLLYDADGRYDWATLDVEVTRRHAVTAHTQLADLIGAEQPDQAARYLKIAADVDPINEPVAVAAMRAHAAVGDVDAVRARFTALTVALQDHGQEPGDDTAALAAELCRQPTTRPQKTRQAKTTGPETPA
ncbi:BTAD domain-containing putative transcriptional regulator [Phytohabitans houttuyneae]|uniref:LysM domain-containing protein n=1 Tax=Phytohabitans houttuyneae TaxID=1076126 RepID=A0A6V8K1A3_9ACTN|nr:BTAD domain-containing putative transcriptional regulator [Phytohabitans houttuyneae]GFJ77474.1 hypothetical protein Phou_016540 [Phytohabitans houttuyneae]